MEAADGRWAAFEIKLGVGMVEEGIATLLRFRDRVDTRKCGKPRALGVVVATGYGYQRPDGVHVIPVGTRSVDVTLPPPPSAEEPSAWVGASPLR